MKKTRIRWEAINAAEEDLVPSGVVSILATTRKLTITEYPVDLVSKILGRDLSGGRLWFWHISSDPTSSK